MENRQLDQYGFGYPDVRPLYFMGAAYRYRDPAHDVGNQTDYPAVRVRQL